MNDLFINLVFGLQAYVHSTTPTFPNSLRCAINGLAFQFPDEFPKTMYRFITLCHQPVLHWYGEGHPDFNASQPLLYDGKLSDEAYDFYLMLTEEMQLSPSLQQDITQSALDNLKIIELRRRLKDMPDRHKAQQLYIAVRSFLIEHSWATSEQLRSEPHVFHELRVFYEEIPSLWPDTLLVCEHCGLLEWRDEHWQGIKPVYCSDHGTDSPYINTIQHRPQLFRLKGGIHLRTFLPGRLELALFTFAEQLQTEHPQYLLRVERYPGIDTYDLALEFSDGEIWAVDAKDQAHPKRLARSIQLPYGEGELAYHHIFYVIPDARMDEPDYRHTLEHAVVSRPSYLHLLSLSEFQVQLIEKVKSLSPHTKKGKRT